MAGTLGDYFKVSRAMVTRDRAFFVMSKAEAKAKGLAEFAIPVITSSREFAYADVLRDGPERPVVIVVPGDIDRSKHPHVDAWLRSREGSEPTGSRAVWWTFGVKRPAAAATYKGEKGPRLVANPDGMALLNVAYALDPIQKMTAADIEDFVRRFNAKSRPSGHRQALSMSTSEVAAARL